MPQCSGAVRGTTGRSLKEVELTAVKKSPAGTTKATPAQKKVNSAKAAPKKGAAKATSVTKASAKKTAAKTPAAKSTAKAASKSTAKKSTAGASGTRAATKAPATKSTATKAAAKGTAKAAAKGATKAPTKTAATKAPAVKAVPAKVPAKKAVPEAPKRPTVGPYAKDQKFLDAQRVLLLEERTIYAGQAVDLRADADSLALEREPGDVQFDEESGEGGTVTVDRERNLALSAQAIAAVEEINDALTKLDRKTYGFCERCFQAIPKARLQALPFARLCVACKSGGLSRR